MRFAQHPWSIALAALLAACASGPGEPEGSQSSELTCPSGPLPQGVDTSAGQGTVDWSTMKSDGVDWVIVKATQAIDYDDPAFVPNWGPAKAAGVARGAYHFFDPTVDGVAQANYFLSKVGALDAEDLSPALDVECPTGASNCLGYAGGSGAVDAATFRQRMLDWLGTVEAATGRKPILYTYSSFFEGTGAAGTGTNVDTTGLDAYPLWLADPTTSSCIGVPIPAPWTGVHVWQFSDTGTFAGVGPDAGPTAFDVDRMVDSIDELLGWPAIVHESRADVNGDGRADACGRAPSGVTCALATTGGSFGAPFAGPAWSDANGWLAPRYASTVQLADIDGDGEADVCGRAIAGLVCARSQSTGQTAGFGGSVSGPPWSDAEGWSRPEYYATIQLADVNGDGKADACARAAAGIVCSIAGDGGDAGVVTAGDAGSVGPSWFGPQLPGPAWSDAAGWAKPSQYRTIRFPDVNGDGKADVCGRSSDGVHCALSEGSTFGADFAGPAWTDATGWAAAAYASTIAFVDVNGDGMSDACARGAAGITCAPSQGSSFGAAFAGPAWSDAAGWNAPARYASIVWLDVDGDGRTDVCGRAASGMTCALSTGEGFGPELAGPAWSDSGSWNEARYYGTIRGGDIDGDGKADLCARGAAGVTCALSTGTGFAPEIAGPTWSDATWGVLPYWATFAVVGEHARGSGALPGDGGVVPSPSPIDASDGGLSISVSGSASASAGGSCACRQAPGAGASEGAWLLVAITALVAKMRRRAQERSTQGTRQ